MHSHRSPLAARPSRRARRGGCRAPSAFTLVELLVVIAIIGILIAILLPAVQSARASARNTECRNHLKQMALAILEHESAFRYYPDGGEHFWYHRTKRPDGRPELAPKQHWGWAYQILPYIEQENVWRLDDDFAVANNVISTYYCPQRRPARLVNNQANGPGWTHGPRGMLDYGGNAGTDCPQIGGWGIRGNGLTAPITRRPDPSRSDRGQSVTVADIRDGTTSTLLLGEKLMNAAMVGSQDLGDDDGGFADGWDFDNMRWGCYPPGPDIHDPNMPVHSGRYAAQRGAFGSSHSGWFNGALCDGSVRGFSFNIDFETFKDVCNREDGDVVSLPD